MGTVYTHRLPTNAPFEFSERILNEDCVYNILQSGRPLANRTRWDNYFTNVSTICIWWPPHHIIYCAARTYSIISLCRNIESELLGIGEVYTYLRHLCVCVWVTKNVPLNIYSIDREIYAAATGGYCHVDVESMLHMQWIFLESSNAINWVCVCVWTTLGRWYQHEVCWHTCRQTHTHPNHFCA